MIVVTPQDHAKGIDFLGDALEGRQSGEVHQNIFDKIIEEINKSSDVDFLQETKLVLPQFTVESDLDVVDNLQNVRLLETSIFPTYIAASLLFQLGIKAAFNVGEFGKMSTSQDLRVSSVKHKAVVEVTTDGTEGAAATGIDVIPLFGSFEPPPEFRVDKPFMFMVYDTLQKTFLFVGKINNPT